MCQHCHICVKILWCVSPPSQTTILILCEVWHTYHVYIVWVCHICCMYCSNSVCSFGDSISLIYVRLRGIVTFAIYGYQLCTTGISSWGGPGGHMLHLYMVDGPVWWFQQCLTSTHCGGLWWHWVHRLGLDRLSCNVCVVSLHKPLCAHAHVHFPITTCHVIAACAYLYPFWFSFG